LDRHAWQDMNEIPQAFCKVFKPGPVQGPGFGFWPSHRVLTGSAGSISILKEIQNGVVLVKKKSTGCNQVLPGQPAGSAGSHLVMAYSIFSSTRPGSNPGSAGSRVDLPGWAGFQNTGFLWQFLTINELTLWVNTQLWTPSYGIQMLDGFFKIIIHLLNLRLSHWLAG